MKPLLVRSGLTGTIWVVTRYKDHGDGRIEAQTKYDVTDQFLSLVDGEMDGRKRAESVQGDEK